MTRKRILIVDDDTALLQMLEDGIELLCADCEVERATDGRAALRHLARHSFDLVLTDYHMPGMNGLELAVVVRQALPHTRIVLMTAYGEGERVQDGIRALDLEGYLKKPFSMKQLWALLEDLPQGVS
jgi:YesN/AraC family two-component response regulator